MCSFLEKTREQGYSTDAEEFMDGMVAVAVPVLDNLGRLTSTLSLHAPTQRVSLEDLVKHLDRLKEAASELSELMLR